MCPIISNYHGRKGYDGWKNSDETGREAHGHGTKMLSSISRDPSKNNESVGTLSTCFYDNLKINLFEKSFVLGNLVLKDTPIW